MLSSSSIGPTVVLNIRLNGRGSVKLCVPPSEHFSVGIDLIGAKALLAFAAVDERIGERRFVTGVLQDEPVHQDRGIESFHVVALVDVGAPPGTLDVVLELDAHRAVVPRALQASVQFAALKQEPAPLAEPHDLVHRHVHRSK